MKSKIISDTKSPKEFQVKLDEFIKGKTIHHVCFTYFIVETPTVSTQRYSIREALILYTDPNEA